MTEVIKKKVVNAKKFPFDISYITDLFKRQESLDLMTRPLSKTNRSIFLTHLCESFQTLSGMLFNGPGIYCLTCLTLLCYSNLHALVVHGISGKWWEDYQKTMTEHIPASARKGTRRTINITLPQQSLKSGHQIDPVKQFKTVLNSSSINIKGMPKRFPIIAESNNN